MGPISAALLFPETEPSAYNIASLLFFFKSISFYLPTEADTADKSLVNLFGNLCNAYVPAPLGADLTRFNRLLREMEISSPDELARLFSAAKAPLTTGQIRDRDETSTGSVFSALQSDTEKKITAEFKERLWQSRLILKLAEILDRRDREVTQGMARVALSEQRVFASLEGISDMDAEDLATLPDLEKLMQKRDTQHVTTGVTRGASALLAPLRIKAWAELFLADASLQRPSVLVAANAACGSILLDGCEETSGMIPYIIFTLSLPIFPFPADERSAKKSYMQARNNMRAAAGAQLEHFKNFFIETAELVSPLARKKITLLTEHADSWNRVAESMFSADRKTLRPLVFYHMPGISPTSLFQKLYHLGPAPSPKRKDHPSTILAILQN
jgi:hypothetical protein